jgi:hypothetical protein
VSVSPRYLVEYKNQSREAAPADVIAAVASRLDALPALFIRADARSYVLPSLRDSQLCDFTTYASSCEHSLGVRV